MKKFNFSIFFMIALFLLSGNALIFAYEAAEISHGPVISGGASGKKMKIWLRTSRSAAVKIEYSNRHEKYMYHKKYENEKWKHSLLSQEMETTHWTDYTKIIVLENLDPSTRYYYRIWVNGTPEPDVHEFTTAPLWAEEVTFSFAVLTDFNRGNVPVYETVAEFDPTFLIFLGDLDHRDPQTLEQMRQMHRDHRGDMPAGQDYKTHLMKYPLYHVWDDHDFGTNDADKYFAGKQDALVAFREYFIVPAYQSQDGIWHSFRYAQAEFFMLDLRSQRDPSAMPDGPEKSILGTDQKAWLKNKLLASNATWKFLMSSVPFNKGTKPGDSWAAFPTETQELIDFIHTNQITGVVIISGDIHSGGAIDDGTNSDFPELSVPHANMNPANCYTAGQPGQWSEGIECGTDRPGFGFITVTPGQVFLNAVGLNGAVRKSLTVNE